ncbi:MAG: MFS transporter [Phycisphaerales bacterium]|nr:MFS transporter [Phycisphaerales bacterium]
MSMYGKKSKYRTAPAASASLPGGIPYIIGNEAAERFSFYGMKGILTIFMAQMLVFMPGGVIDSQMSDSDVVSWYHWFVSAVYITPLLGAFIADAFLGKYLTIMLLSIVYCLGHGALALMGAQLPFIDGPLNPSFFFVLGLILICLGSGGIKPCVSAHVGDQFGESSAKIWLTKIFMVFYLSINIGAALSNLATPWLLHHYGPHWAFGVPGVLMAIATLTFWLGRNKFIHVPPGGMAFVREVFSARGIKALLKLSIIYLFVAVFWALFDQTGSTWILQAEDMNREWLGLHWLSAQIQAINPVMILILTPLFGWVVYPAIDKVWPLTPMRKMSLGLFIMAGGFSIIAIAQGFIDAGHTPSIGWQVLAYAIVTTAEVLVSITCLEFSYTQAPRKMKSIIMGFFLASVTVGNVITSLVSSVSVAPSDMQYVEAAHERVLEFMDRSGGVMPDEAQGASLLADIQVRDGVQPPVYGVTESGFSIELPASAPEAEALGRAVQFYNTDGIVSSKQWPAMAQLDSAADHIEAYWRDNERLPSNEQAAALLKGEVGPWGRPLVYRLVNRNNFSIGSLGPSGDMLSASSVTVNGHVVHPAGPEDANSWLARRKAELGIEPPAAEDGEITLSRDYQVGGQNRFEGASFFWFFTWLMLGTAIVFVPVAMLYRPATYLMDEEAA